MVRRGECATSASEHPHTSANGRTTSDTPSATEGHHTTADEKKQTRFKSGRAREWLWNGICQANQWGVQEERHPHPPFAKDRLAASFATSRGSRNVLGPPLARLVAHLDGGELLPRFVAASDHEKPLFLRRVRRTEEPLDDVLPSFLDRDLPRALLPEEVQLAEFDPRARPRRPPAASPAASPAARRVRTVGDFLVGLEEPPRRTALVMDHVLRRVPVSATEPAVRATRLGLQREVRWEPTHGSRGRAWRTAIERLLHVLLLLLVHGGRRAGRDDRTHRASLGAGP